MPLQEDVPTSLNTTGDQRDAIPEKNLASVIVWWAILVSMFAGGAILRFHGITRTSLWLDEYWAVYLSTGRGDQLFNLPRNTVMLPPAVSYAGAPAWWHIPWGLSTAAHPPLYYIALRWWIDIFGESDLSTRGLSAIFSLLSAAVMYQAVRILSGRWQALAVFAFMLFAPVQLLWAQAARPYAVVMLESALLFLSLARVRDHATRWNAALPGVCAASLLLTHYFTIATIGSCAIYVLACFPPKVRRRTIWSMCAGMFIAAIIWGPVMWSTRQIFAQLTSYALNSSGAMGTARSLLFAPSRLVLETQCSNWLAGAAVFMMCLVIPFFRFRGPAILWWTGLVLNLGMLVAIDFYRHSMLTDIIKYTVLASPALYALLATSWPVRRGWMIPVLCVAGTLAGTFQYSQQPFMMELPDWRAVAAGTDAIDPAAIVVFNGAYDTEPILDYFVVNHYFPIHNKIILTSDGRNLKVPDGASQVWFVAITVPSSATLPRGWMPAHVLHTGGLCEGIRDSASTSSQP